MSDEQQKTRKSKLDDATKQAIFEQLGIDADAELLKPTLDGVFKRMFTADETRSRLALIDLLNSILTHLDEERIEDLIVINPNIPVDVKEQKKSIFDIRARSGSGELSVFEMQTNAQAAFNKRAQFIASRTYTSQPISGEDYAALKKAFLVCIMDFIDDKDDPAFAADYRFRKRNLKELTGDLTVFYIELPKLEVVLHKPVEEMTKLEKWGLFFKYVDDKSKSELMKEMIGGEEGIAMAAQILTHMSGSEEDRIRYEDELIYELDINTRFRQAKREGRLEGISEGKVAGRLEGLSEGKVAGRLEGLSEGKVAGKLEIAAQMLLMGYSLDAVSEITGFDKETLQGLKQAPKSAP